MTDRVESVAVDHDGVAHPVNDTCPVCCKPIVGAESLHYTGAVWVHRRCAAARVHSKHCHDCGKPVDVGGDNARHTFRGWAHVNCLAENVRRVPRNVPPGGTHGALLAEEIAKTPPGTAPEECPTCGVGYGSDGRCPVCDTPVWEAIRCACCYSHFDKESDMEMGREGKLIHTDRALCHQRWIPTPKPTDDLLEAIDEHLSTLCADDLDVVLGVVEGLRRARGHHGH